MKMQPFSISKKANSALLVQDYQADLFYDRLHHHPEIQITLIVKGRGTAIIGNHIKEFHPEDLFIVGPKQPHVFRSDNEYHMSGDEKVHSVSIYFDADGLWKEMLDLEESQRLKEFLELTRSGIKVEGSYKITAGKMIRGLEDKEGLSRIILFLGILNLLSAAKDYEKFSISASESRLREIDGQHLNELFNFTLDQYQRKIELWEVAGLIDMSIHGFCRYFKKHTRKTYFEFLNEVRVENACRLLQETDQSIADICKGSGFNNISNFNRHFKRVKGLTPREFRSLH